MGLLTQVFVISAFVAVLQCVPVERSTTTSSLVNNGGYKQPLPATVAHKHSSEESDESKESKRPARDTNQHKVGATRDHPKVGGPDSVHKLSTAQNQQQGTRKVRDAQQQSHPQVGGPGSIHKPQTLPAKLDGSQQHPQHSTQPLTARKARDSGNQNRGQKRPLPAKVDKLPAQTSPKRN